MRGLALGLIAGGALLAIGQAEAAPAPQAPAPEPDMFDAPDDPFAAVDWLVDSTESVDPRESDQPPIAAGDGEPVLVRAGEPAIDANLQAFLMVIRAGEGTADADGYRRLFGGGHFQEFTDHPRRYIRARLGGAWITSSAAGAYQILARTWDELQRVERLTDFAPASQDAAAVALIRRRGALADVRAGRLDSAIAKCAREWSSLPGSPYGQPTLTPAAARKLYLAAGGNLVGVFYA